MFVLLTVQTNLRLDHSSSSSTHVTSTLHRETSSARKTIVAIVRLYGLCCCVGRQVACTVGHLVKVTRDGLALAICRKLT